MKQTYRGKLTYWSNGEEHNILSIEGTDRPLAEQIKEHMAGHGPYLSVRYWTSSVELTEAGLLGATALLMCGAGTVDYEVFFSDITGYLWTNEELQVGGHDLLAELKGHVGRWLHMEIEYARSAPVVQPHPPMETNPQPHEPSNETLPCEDCGARTGDVSKVDKDLTVHVSMFHGKRLCSDCMDAFVYCFENADDPD